MVSLCSVAVCGGRVQKGDYGHSKGTRTSGVLSGRKLSPGNCPNARHFNFSPCAMGALLATALVQKPRVSEHIHELNPTWDLYVETPENVQFLPLTQHPLVFTARCYGNLSSWHRNPRLDCLVGVWDPSLLRFPSQFLSTTHGCGTAPSMSPYLSVYLHVSAPPTRLDE